MRIRLGTIAAVCFLALSPVVVAHALSWSDPVNYTMTDHYAGLPTVGSSVSTGALYPGGLLLQVREYNLSCYGHGTLNDTTTSPGVTYSFTATTTPWTPTGTWAFASRVEGYAGVVKDGTAGQVTPNGYRISPTGGTHPTESRISFGLFSEPAAGSLGDSPYWRPRALYANAVPWLAAPSFLYSADFTGRLGLFYGVGGKHEDNTYYWSCVYAFAFTGAQGSYIVTGTIVATASATPPTLDIQMPTGYTEGFNSSNYWPYMFDFAAHQTKVDFTFWCGGTTDPSEAQALADVLPSALTSETASIEPTLPAGQDFGFGWTTDWMSSFAGSLKSMGDSISGWFWPITQMGGW